MADIQYSHAITTVARIKTRLAITDTGHDAQFTSAVNSVTDFIEGETGRRFAQEDYADEVYSIAERGIRFLVLRNTPVASVTRIQRRAGTKSSPSWTSYDSDDWFLQDDGESGIVEFFGDLPKGPNTVRASYKAGYVRDFDNYGDRDSHTLPADITDLAEKLVERAFRRINSEGKTQEGFEGGNITWSRTLTKMDKEVLARYKRLTLFI